jgi:endonuclease/exonuclease/phosphatase family metal-dependent hydrolase
MLLRALFLVFISLTASVPSLAAIRPDLTPRFGLIPERGSFCLQTFNVYGPAYATGVKSRLARLAQTLLREPCEALQFQEFWRAHHYEDFTQAMYPSRQAFLFADSLRGDQAMIGLASGFSGSVARAESSLFEINYHGGWVDDIRWLFGVQKGFTALEVKIDHGPLGLFLNAHTHPHDKAIRLAQVVQLTEHLLLREERAAELPLFLTGDFNDVPGSLTMRLLHDVLQFRDAYAEANGSYQEECTYCSDNPLSWSNEDRVLDFVLVRSSPGIELVAERAEINLRGEKDSPLSDHYGVRTELGWQEREAALLDGTDSLVVARKERAVLTLNAVARTLELTGKAALQKMGRRALALRDRIRRGKLPEWAEASFRIP